MSKISDPGYLRTEQYKNASNLNARIDLHERFSTNPYGWHLWVFDQFHLGPRARILELGCGPGRLWVENLRRIPEGWEVTLSDFSPGMLHQARESLRDSAHPFAYALADAQAIPFAGQSFDAVVANHMLYHVPDRPKALSEIHRILRPGGHLYAATNGQAHMAELYDLVLRAEPGLRSWGEPLSLGFGLENGREELSPWFSQVTLWRYDDSLEVTEVEPLVAYVLSMSIGAGFDLTKVAEFKHLVEQEIAANSAIYITKESGLFEAIR